MAAAVTAAVALTAGCGGATRTAVDDASTAPPAMGGSTAETAPAADAARPSPDQDVLQGTLQFDDVTATSGIDFRHQPTYSAGKHMPEIQGSGVVVADFDRNGAPDILAVNSGALATDERPADAANALYLNDGRGTFTDATAAWGLPSEGYGLGATAGDVDNDGWTDVVLTGFGDATRVLRNTGTAFEDFTAQSGIPGDLAFTTSAGLFDADGDGDLDLFLARYVHYDVASSKPCRAGSVLIYCTPHLFDGLPDLLFRNDGSAGFVDVTAASGIVDTRGKGLAVTIADIELDGDVDIYVANDLTPNQLWLNDGTGQFSDVATRAGAAMSNDGRAQAGMGSDISDIDGDGRFDIAVSNFTSETTSIFRQMDGLLFEEQADDVGIGPSSRLRLKWGTTFFDADNDGDEDLMVVAGNIYDNAPEVEPSLTFAEQNLLYENVGGGQFEDVSNRSGAALLDVQVSRGLAIADFDSDGGLDFVVSNSGGTLQMGRNRTPDRGPWVGLWLEGSTANRSAVGTVVRATVGERVLLRQVKGADSYLSLSDRRIVLGTGSDERVDETTITWPDGEIQALGPLAVGNWYRVVQGSEPAPFTPGEAVILP